MTKTQPTTDNGPRTTDKSNWRLYAAAAGAALAFTTGADASIIYSGKQDLHFGPGGGTFMVGGERVSVGGFHSTGGRTGGGSERIAIDFPGAILHSPGRAPALNFNSGNPIGGGSLGATAVLLNQGFTTYGLRTGTGKFVPGQSGFVGLEFVGGNAAWIHVDVDADANGYPDGLEVIDWAYNNAGGISAGQGVTVPEPSALGLLAMGSAGVLAWRRRTACSGTERR